MNVPQRKLFGIMVALAHCVLRHHDRTEFERSDSIAVVFAPNVFSWDENRNSVYELKTAMPNLFSDILDKTQTPTEFREMFYSLFPGAKPPPDCTVRVVARPSAEASAPVMRRRKKLSGRLSLLRSSAHHAKVISSLSRSPQPIVGVRLTVPTEVPLHTGGEEEENDGSDDELSRSRNGEDEKGVEDQDNGGANQDDAVQNQDKADGDQDKVEEKAAQCEDKGAGQEKQG